MRVRNPAFGLLSSLILSGCNPLIFFKCPDKITQVIKSVSVCDLCNGIISSSQLAAGLLDPLPVQVVHRSLMCHLGKKSAEVFKHAYQELQKQSIDHFEDQLIFIVDQVIGALNANPTLLKLISKHLSWGMFKNSLVEPIDDAQRNIYDIYMDLLKNSGHEFDHPEVMIYMIIEMVAGSCYNVILTGEPVSVDELKPYLYQSIRLIIQNHIL